MAKEKNRHPSHPKRMDGMDDFKSILNNKNNQNHYLFGKNEKLQESTFKAQNNDRFIEP